jgi:hypothetical protein
MSQLIVITAEMHKIAEFFINVKYRRPGNVITYIPIEFEVFINGEYYKAVPLQTTETRMLTSLPCSITFQIKNGKVYNDNRGTEDIVKEIVGKLVEMNIVELSQKRFEETNSKNQAYSSLYL